MVTKLRKVLTLLLCIITIYLSSNSVAWANDVVVGTNSKSVVTEVRELTPQKRQQLQAIQQKRNREIKAVLNPEQIESLSRNIRRGDNLNQALRKLKLEPQQQKLIDTIVQLSDLKTQAARN
jgi:ribonuclease HII